MMGVCTCTEVQHMITKIAYVILDCTSLVHQTNLCHSVKTLQSDASGPDA